jgi:hypothetical protein
MNGISLEDLEKLTDTLYGQKQDQSITEYSSLLAQNYINNYQKYEELLQYFIRSTNAHCQFWLLHLLIQVINKNQMSLNDSDREKIRKYLMLIFNDYIQKITQQTFISNKFGLLFITWIKYDYPEKWPGLFKDLMGDIFNSPDDTKLAKISKVNLI